MTTAVTEKSEHDKASGPSPVTASSTVLSLDALCDIIQKRFGKDFEITQREHGDGSSEAILEVDGALRASWRGRLKNTPIYDGKTPRGPKAYYDLQFFAPSIPKSATTTLNR